MSLLMWLLMIVVYLAVGLALGRLFTTRYVRLRRSQGHPRNSSLTHDNSVLLALITLIAWPTVLAVYVVRLFFLGLYKVLMKAMLPAELEQ